VALATGTARTETIMANAIMESAAMLGLACMTYASSHFPGSSLFLNSLRERL
jgi:hypothetical protein